MRDGFFFGALVDAYPYFLATPLLAIAGIYSAKTHPHYRIWAVIVMAIFFALPQTHHFASYWFFHLSPFRS
jgi:hypothetical protein